MVGHIIHENKDFIGRVAEWKRLDEIIGRKQASLIVIHGRRRVGKTELVEQYFRKRIVFKFEGIEPDSAPREGTKRQRIFQITCTLKRLSQYLEAPFISKMPCQTWTDFFAILDDVASKRNVVLYFEEIQWLCDYSGQFFAELKPFWDDRWRHNPNLVVIICGSSVSFIRDQLLSSKALYARAQEEIQLAPFSLVEIMAYLGHVGPREAMLAQLTVGGIPEYLKRLRGKGTVLGNLCKHSFLPDSFFYLEKDKIFVSSLHHNLHYKKIVAHLAKCKFASALSLTKALKGEPKSGGSITTILNDLERMGFIEKYTPLHKGDQSKLVRYAILDPYLQFYYRFIHPMAKKIEGRVFLSDPIKGLNRRAFEVSMGFAFERWCRNQAHLFAKILGFSGVDYRAGAFFDHKSEKEEPGFQIDLMYIIKGSKIVICEIKYYDGLVGNEVCQTVKRKVERFQKSMPQYKNYTIDVVLITTEGVKDKETIESVFDHVITFDDIFAASH